MKKNSEYQMLIWSNAQYPYKVLNGVFCFADDYVGKLLRVENVVQLPMVFQ